MPEIIKTDEPPPSAGHEDSDINVRAIFKFAAYLAGFVALSQLVLAWMFWSFDDDYRAAQPKPSPLVQKERPRLPQDLTKIPPPRLQTTEVDDLARLRKKEVEILESYGVVDGGKKVRIPIERAMEMLADPMQAATHGVKSRR